MGIYILNFRVKLNCISIYIEATKNIGKFLSM